MLWIAYVEASSERLLKERKWRTKDSESLMQKPVYEQFLKERRDAQKYVSNERR